jgi:5-formyltetrahydrofolate cyclo-ligase
LVNGLVVTDEEASRQKSKLRRECLGIRKTLGVEMRAQASLAICACVESWSVFQLSQTILSYMPIKSEVDLTPLLARHSQKRWALPRIIPEENHRMVFHEYAPDRMIRHPFGMEEPTPDSTVIHPAEIELALVPGVAFDRRGFRLGYGGGYFDRFLENFEGISAGIVFNALLLEAVPRAAHDIAMQWVATEDGVFKAGFENISMP